MANEKNGMATATTNTETTEKKLYVVREPINDKMGNQYKTEDGSLYFAYILKGELQGKETKIDFTPPDKGGYEPLNFVFNVSDKAELIISEEEQRDNDGKISRYNSYLLRTVDKDGIPWEADIKPQRKSDKSLLRQLLRVQGIAIDIY